MPKEIQIGDFAIVFDAKTVEMEFARLAFFEWVRAVNQVAAWIILPDVIEATVQMCDINCRFEVLDEQERCSEENHAACLLSTATKFRIW